ncbi:MAG: hypothetical protein IPM02_00030 [Betaproteobacteria bacterium]|nr:hypothetical protein [Betaproteobacteria bacterium]
MAVARLGTEVPQIGFPFRMTLSDGSDAFAARREPPALGEARDEFVPATQRTQSHVDVS